MKKRWMVSLTAALLLSGCGAAATPAVQAQELTQTPETTETVTASTGTIFDYDAFSNKTAATTEYTLSSTITAKLTSFDLMSEFDRTNCFLIKLNDSDVDVHVGLEGNSLDAQTETDRIMQSIAIEDNKIRITREGTYVFEGSLSNGQICVDAPDTDKVQLVLNNVSVHCSDSAAIYIINADKALITIPEGTDNQLTDGALYSEEIKGCIFSICDLTINGDGNLKVEGSFNNGISCKDDLKIVGGNLTVTAVNNGLKGNDSVAFYGGNVTVTAGGDGVKTDSTDEGKGYL